MISCSYPTFGSILSSPEATGRQSFHFYHNTMLCNLNLTDVSLFLLKITFLSPWSVFFFNLTPPRPNYFCTPFFLYRMVAPLNPIFEIKSIIEIHVFSLNNKKTTSEFVTIFPRFLTGCCIWIEHLRWTKRGKFWTDWQLTTMCSVDGNVLKHSEGQFIIPYLY